MSAKRNSRGRETTKNRWVAAVVVLVLVAAGGWFGVESYPGWKHQRLMTQTRAYAAAKEYRLALLTLKEAIQARPEDVEACTLMAEFAEQFGSREAIFWRRRVAELQPDFLQHRLAWARTSLRMNDKQDCILALQTVNEAGRRTAAFNNLAASLAIALNQTASAEFHAGEAVRIEPTNEGYQFNLANLRIRSTDPVLRDRARQTLERLSQTKEFHPQAIRTLAAAALDQNDLATALAYSRELQRENPVPLGDDILHLNILEAARNREVDSWLTSMQARYSKGPEALQIIAAWMIEHGRARATLVWLKTLPESQQQTAEIRLSHAEALARLRDWKTLEQFASGQEWKEQEFMRYAILARASRELGQTAAFQRQWGEAVNSANDQAVPLALLNKTALSWGWEAESEELLWSAVNNCPQPSWALQSLASLYQGRGNTRELLRVTQRMIQLNPEDISARNNHAVLSLLLNVDVEQAYRTARELFDKYPGDPVTVSTHSFALYHQGKTEEGLKIMSRLREEQLNSPPVAAYFGVMLAASSNPSHAVKFLDLGLKAPLLPEEKSLLQKARLALGSR